jgi:hypothetical protein
MGHAAHGSVGRLGDGQPLLASASGESEQVGGTTAADRHPDLFEVPEQGRSGDADTIRDALERFTGYVRANNCRAVPVLVTATDTELYAGFVYNFSAHVGWYSANGLVVHNCRCTAEPPAADLLEALLNAPDEPPTDELTPVDQAIAGLADAELDYLREGMRDLAPVEAAYAGATPEEVELISTGQSKTKNSVSAFDPIKIESGPTASGRQFTLTDGRHRLAAARKAGAKKIAAIVDNRRVVIPLPTV